MITQKQLYKLPGSTTSGFRMTFIGTEANRDAVPTNHWTIKDGDMWYDTTNNALYIYVDGTWTLLTQLGMSVREAFVDGSVPASDEVDCFLDTDTTGDPITVTCTIAGGSSLASAFPRLADGMRMPVYYDGTNWRSYILFQTSTVCS